MEGPYQIMREQDHPLTINTLYGSPRRSDDPVFNQTFTVGNNLYSTLPNRFNATLKVAQTLKNSNYRLKLKQIANSPFRRISRVEKIISHQKNYSRDNSRGQESAEAASNHMFKPQFKVKTRKIEAHKHQQQLLDHSSEQVPTKVHLKNISLEGGTEFLEEHRNVHNLNYFQENLKNKMRITKKNQRKRQQSSLLQMLNRLSNSSPQQRYKSKPVTPAITAFPIGVGL